MLSLRVASNPGWITAANANITALLIDHAHCEKKAAANGISLVNRYPERPRLIEAMLALAREELEHCDRVYRILNAREVLVTRDRGDQYARLMQEHIRKGEPERLLDTLLISALIEARSCERFTILSRECIDLELRTLYADLLASEAGHHAMFTELAREVCGAALMKLRLDELAGIEAGIVRKLPNKATMHG